MCTPCLSVSLSVGAVNGGCWWSLQLCLCVSTVNYVFVSLSVVYVDAVNGVCWSLFECV